MHIIVDISDDTNVVRRRMEVTRADRLFGVFALTDYERAIAQREGLAELMALKHVLRVALLRYLRGTS